MASKFERGINLLRFQMICSTEKLGLLCKWIIFKKVDDPELKVFLKVCDNLEKAAAVLLPLDPIDGTSNEDLAAELQVGSIGLKESFTLVNEMKAQFEDLKSKLDLIVSWIISKTLDDNDLKELLNLACQYATAPALVLLPLTDQIVSKYLQEFEKLKSKMELLKSKLKLICGWIIYKKVQDSELKGLLKYLCNQEKTATAPNSSDVNNADVSTFGESDDESTYEDDEESEDDACVDKTMSNPSPQDEESSDSNGGYTYADHKTKQPETKRNKSQLTGTGSKSLISKPTLKTTTSKDLQRNVCNKKFPHPSTLKAHLPMHSGQKNHECGLCKKRFARVCHLNVHKRQHEGVKPYRCNTCTKEFSTAGKRKQHEIIHTGEKNYSCNTCRKSFARSSSLTLHKRIHTKEKPYNCIHCGTKFRQIATLNRHQLTHTGEKPHNCVFCGKDFTRRNGLITHLRIHTGEKPFGCSDCNKQFRSRSNLRSHRQNHHPSQ